MTMENKSLCFLCASVAPSFGCVANCLLQHLRHFWTLDSEVWDLQEIKVQEDKIVFRCPNAYRLESPAIHYVICY